VNKFTLISSLALTLAFAAGVRSAPAQETAYAQFRAHNVQMKGLQPSWMGPVIQSDARLGQGVKFAVSNSDFPPVHPTIYGNNKGVSVIVQYRFQLDFDPPSFFRNHSSAQKDGFGNAATQVKYRIASGNADHGNFALTAVLFHGFGPRTYQNQLLSAYYVPSIAAGKAFGRFATLTTLGGFLPTAKIAAQGRAVDWNFTAQLHASEHVWFDIENNASFFHAGPFDGKVQNFITPAAFYMVRRKEWQPEHAAIVFDCAEQMATSSFHVYNHNLITEMRIMF
jgi:hypothetical protein